METVNVHLEWMLIPLFCNLTGYTPKAIQRKIEDGKWIEGRMFKRAPDGHITINLQEYYRWVNGLSRWHRVVRRSTHVDGCRGCRIGGP